MATRDSIAGALATIALCASSAALADGVTYSGTMTSPGVIEPFAFTLIVETDNTGVLDYTDLVLPQATSLVFCTPNNLGLCFPFSGFSGNLQIGSAIGGGIGTSRGEVHWNAVTHDVGYHYGSAQFGSGTISAINGTPIPEPSSWALLALGLFAIGVASPRRRWVSDAGIRATLQDRARSRPAAASRAKRP